MRLLTVLALTTLVACGGGESSTGSGPSTSPSAAPGLPDAAPQEDVGTVLAVVGGEKIGSKSFELAAARTPVDGDALGDEQKREVLEGLIRDEVLYREALNKGLYRDPKVKKIMINLLLRQEVYGSVRNSDFSNDELRAHFETNKEDFVVPEKIQLKRIFVKAGATRTDAEAAKLAKDLHAKLKAGAEFKDLAVQHSEDPYKRRGGDLGYVSKEGKPGIDPAVIEKAFTMAVGQLSEPFQAAGGYNILFVANKRERVERTFDQMKGSVLRKLKNERYETLTEDYVANVRSNYTVEIKEDELKKIEVRPSRRMSLGPDGAGAGLARPGRAGLLDEHDDHDEEGE